MVEIIALGLMAIILIVALMVHVKHEDDIEYIDVDDDFEMDEDYYYWKDSEGFYRRKRR